MFYKNYHINFNKKKNYKHKTIHKTNNILQEKEQGHRNNQTTRTTLADHYKTKQNRGNILTKTTPTTKKQQPF